MKIPAFVSEPEPDASPLRILSDQELTNDTLLRLMKSSLLAPALLKLLRADQLNRLYRETSHLKGIDFIDAVLERLGVRFETDEKELKHIPAQGAFIVVANHPLGGLDGLILLRLMLAVRPEFRVMANYLLSRLHNIEPHLVPVNPFRRNGKHNLPGLRRALELIHNDVPIGIFPAGEVSSYSSSTGRVSDPEWQPVVGKIVERARVPVVPVYMSGGNSLSFNLLGLVHPVLRTLRLPAELFNKQGLAVKVRVGRPVPYAELKDLRQPDMLLYLRARTYALGSSLFSPVFRLPHLWRRPSVPMVIPETDPALVAADLRALKPASLLVVHRQFEVYLARKGEIPNVMREIGRLRELTFRQAGEGTMNETDLDVYDNHYHHLFLYDRHEQLLVGAYRIGKGKEILKKYGKKGLYLHSLFRMKDELLPVLRQSVELGRSFVREEYQRRPLPLLLLWKGIAVFLEGKLSYQYLIGPVSISDCLSSASKALMVKYITERHYDHRLARLVKPRKRFRYRFSREQASLLLNSSATDLHTLDSFLSDIEPTHTGMPVLLKRYLRQNARIIGFNIDPRFSNTLDGFMIMDVEDLPAATQQLLDRIS